MKMFEEKLYGNLGKQLLSNFLFCLWYSGWIYKKDVREKKQSFVIKIGNLKEKIKMSILGSMKDLRITR